MMRPQTESNAPLAVEQVATTELPFKRARVVMAIVVIGLLVGVFVLSPPIAEPEADQSLAPAATNAQADNLAEDRSRSSGSHFGRFTGSAISGNIQTATPIEKLRPSDASSQPGPLTWPGLTGFAARVDVGGYALYIECLGQDRPTVIMDAGLDDTADTWGEIPLEVAEVTKVCVYDRAGLGRSDPGPKPRTSRQLVTELHALFSNAGIRGPYILVGHSFGGYNVRLYTNEYPDEVVGMVLVDAAHEEQLQQMYAILSPGMAEEDLPYPQNEEGVDLRASGAQLRATGTLGDIPLVVLTHGQHTLNHDLDFPGQMEQLWFDLQGDLASLSSKSRHIVAKESGHNIQDDQPELVIESISQMVEAIRAVNE